MRKTICASFFLGLTTILVSFSQAGGPDKKLHTKCLYPVLLVSPADRPQCGSGVVVRSVKVGEGVWHNVFLSCAHVANAYDGPYVVKNFHYENWSVLADSTTYNCQFYAIDPERDLAIGVFISEEELPTADLDFATRLYIGSEAWRIGCGLGDEPRLDWGKITSVRSTLKSCPGALRTSVHTMPGDSGSPLFHDYKIVGIMKTIRMCKGFPVFGMSFAVPVSSFTEWDKETHGALNFAWRNKRLPQMPFYRLKLREQGLN